MDAIFSARIFDHFRRLEPNWPFEAMARIACFALRLSYISRKGEYSIILHVWIFH